MTFSPGRALAELEAQHAALRDMMDRCNELIGEVDAGRCGPTQLTREVTRLRLAFESHNAFEEKLLRPLLHQNDPFAAARIERMIEDHISEHRTVHQRLGSKDTDDLRDVIETLRAHLDAEERYLLSPRVLRDEQVL
jgi:iron-sulfur cluster repair protein YtfE (RIC family)